MVVLVEEPPLPPEEVEVEEPVDELSISMSMSILPLDPVVPEEPLVEVEVVVDRLTLPPLLPPKKPPKNPPPKPPPKPPEPPMMIG